MEKSVVSSMAVSRGRAIVSVLGVPNQPGIARYVLGTVANARVETGLTIQNLGKDGNTDLSFTVHRSDCARTVELLRRQVQRALGAREIVGDDGVCEVSMVGTGMLSQVGMASRMFGALREAGIQAQMISATETKTSVVIDEKYLEPAVHSLREALAMEPLAAQVA